MDEQEIIEAMKKNERAYCFLNSEKRNMLEAAGRDNTLILHNGEFVPTKQFVFGGGDFIYRLRPDYVAPKREECGWVEVKIDEHQGVYWFIHPNIGDTPIARASGLVGYGGISWVNPCPGLCRERTAGDPAITNFIKIQPPDCEAHGPWIPKRIRFYRRKNNG